MTNADDYRSSVGVVVINRDHKVFMAQRLDDLDNNAPVWPNSWQFPQGGIDHGEEPESAALRELKEETGIVSVQIIDAIPGWLYYDLPTDLARKIWGGQYKGQKQKWFLLKFLGDDAEINLDQAHPEFHNWEWTNIQESPNRVVPFKVAVCKEVLHYFSRWFK